MSNWDLSSAFSRGGEDTLGYMSLAARIAGQKDQLAIEKENSATGALRETDAFNADNAALIGKGSPDMDTIAAAKANQAAVAAGFPADATSPEGRAASTQLDSYKTRLVGMQSAQMADVNSQANLRNADADLARKRAGYYKAMGDAKTGGAGAMDTKGLTTRIGALEKLKTFGSDYYGPDQDAEYQALTSEYNRRLGVTPAPSVLHRGIIDSIGDIARRMMGGGAQQSDDRPLVTRKLKNGKTARGRLNPDGSLDPE